MSRFRLLNALALIGPGILVAATGVGAGDLATGALAGSKLQLTVLWAVLVGAGLKFMINEGLARWQLVTGSTFLEGCVEHFGKPLQFGFLVYLLFWSYCVGSALMSACAVTMHALCPLFGPATDKIVYGILHSAIAWALVLRGGFRLFEKVMAVCIGFMFVTVVSTAVAIGPDPAAFWQGLFIPRIAWGQAESLEWTIALMGGIGGTVTVLCYGYWIRESGRFDVGSLKACRWDLAAGYLMTAVFGLAMVVLGSQIEIRHKGAALLVDLADELKHQLGPVSRWSFLIGAWGAVFSSLLGVWQAMPYLFADYWQLTHAGNPAQSSKASPVSTTSPAYRGYLTAIATVPAIGLWFSFEAVQKLYAIVGAACIPLLAGALLALNGRRRLMGAHRNSLLVTGVLVTALLFFVVAFGAAVWKLF